MALLTDIQVEDLKLSSKEIREIYGIDELIADREERTQLLREALLHLDHKHGCRTRTVGWECSCGFDALLVKIREAIEAQP